MPTGTFSALTFNMQNGQPWDDVSPDTTPVCLERSVAFLRAQNPDILFLQEVEIGWDGGKQQQPPPHYTWLRDQLPEYHSYFEYPPINPDELPFGLGLAIFSRFPLENPECQYLPAADITFEFGGRPRKPSQRLLLTANVDIDGHAVRIANTHLQAYFMIGGTSDQYPEQRQQVLRYLQASEMPTLIGGDFNCSPEEGLIREFASAGYQAIQVEAPTWRRMRFATDHIFYNSGLSLREGRIIHTACSDHHAVQGTFELSDS